MSAQLKHLDKSVLKVFDKCHNQNNETSEVEALQLLSQLPNPAAVRDDDEDEYTLYSTMPVTTDGMRQLRY